MSGDTFLPQPGRGAGRAGQSSALTPLLDQAFNSDTLYLLRAAVQAHASRSGLSEGRVGEVVLAVHELAANAIAHGAGHGRLRLWDLANVLACEITDDGPADPSRPRTPANLDGPRDAEDPSAVTDPWPSADGHGLWLVRQVADQLDVRSGSRGTRAIVTFALPLPEDH
jgi:anti-sigma regulatory factor (Ser/Thr protein kinase)